ncbi:MAG: TRAP transporter large permease [Tagaea sp.]|nr:TRAP transporter large permease [Tagaea sp.]
MTLLLLCGVFAGLLLLGVPIALAIAGSAIFVIWIEGYPLIVMAQRFASGVQSFPLLAIPLFVLAGALMEASGIAKRLFALTSSLVGWIRGGLAHVCVAFNVLLAGLSGSSLADCAVTTRLFVPQMVARGYSQGFATALCASCSTLAPIIPPSILLVIYGWQASVSIGDLFLAGVVPGFVMAVSLMAVIGFVAAKRGIPREGKFSIAQVGRELLGALWAIALPAIIILGFRTGAFTATEIAAVAAGYALFVGLFVYRTIRLPELPAVFAQAARDTGSILLIVAAAAPFGWILAIEQAPQQILAIGRALTDEPWVIMLLINVLLLLLGMFMETLSIILILVPVLLPLLQAMQIDLVHFGIVLAINMVIGQLTPPVGVLMFLSCAIAKTRIADFLREGWPLLAALLGCLLLISYVPWFSLALPTALK